MVKKSDQAPVILLVVCPAASALLKKSGVHLSFRGQGGVDSPKQPHLPDKIPFEERMWSLPTPTLDFVAHLVGFVFLIL